MNVGALNLVDRSREQGRKLQEHALGALPIFGVLLGVEADKLWHDLAKRLHALLCLVGCLLDIAAKLDRAQKRARLLACIVQRQDWPGADLDALHVAVDALGDVEHLPTCG